MAAEGEQELDEVQDDLEESHEETEEEGLETGEQLDEAAGELNEVRLWITREQPRRGETKRAGWERTRITATTYCMAPALGLLFAAG